MVTISHESFMNERYLSKMSILRVSFFDIDIFDDFDLFQYRNLYDTIYSSVTAVRSTNVNVTQ
jgi:hypothetical protein